MLPDMPRFMDKRVFIDGVLLHVDRIAVNEGPIVEAEQPRFSFLDPHGRVVNRITTP